MKRRGVRILACARLVAYVAYVVARAFSTLGAGAAFADEPPSDHFASDAVEAAFPAEPRRAALEDALYDALWRGGSLRDAARNAAQTELAERFPDWEPLSSDRRFLTNGEISPTSKSTFEAAEDVYFNGVYDRACDEFRATVASPDLNAEPPRVPLVVRLPARARVVYLTANCADFLLRDPATGETWRARARYAAQEIAPEPGDANVEFEITLEPSDEGEPGEGEANEGEGIGAKVGALIGFDLRLLAIPFAPARAGEPRLLRAPRRLRFGALNCNDAKADVSAPGVVEVTLRFQYDFAADAFDSHRRWLARDDFRLAFRRTPGVGAPAVVSPERLRFYDRNEFGGSLALTFRLPESSAGAGELALIWLAPRFLGFAETQGRLTARR